MSLLRDALRKAERAQEEARQQVAPQTFALEPSQALEASALPALSESSLALDAGSTDPLVGNDLPAGDGIASNEAAHPSREARIEAPTATASRLEQPVREPNPRLPFFLSVSALALAALLGAGYFWAQLRPPGSILNSSVSRAANNAVTAAKTSSNAASGEPLLASVEQALASLPDPAESLLDTQGVKSGGPTQESSASTEHKPRAAASQLLPPEFPGQLAAGIEQPRVQAGNESDQAGDTTTTGARHFTLGNEHALAGRWTHAQQAYARAFAEDPKNPDFAFNLAVSHDRLLQRREALAHYRRALELQGTRLANFSAETARERIRQIARRGT